MNACVLVEHEKNDQAWHQNLRALADATGLTDSELARRAGMNRTTFHRYVNGKIRPPFKRVFQLAELFGVETDHIDPKWDTSRQNKHPLPLETGLNGSFKTRKPPYTLSPAINDDPEMTHLHLHMDMRHEVMARVLCLVAEERLWQAAREQGLTSSAR